MRSKPFKWRYMGSHNNRSATADDKLPIGEERFCYSIWMIWSWDNDTLLSLYLCSSDSLTWTPFNLLWEPLFASMSLKIMRLIGTCSLFLFFSPQPSLPPRAITSVVQWASSCKYHCLSYLNKIYLMLINLTPKLLSFM